MTPSLSQIQTYSTAHFAAAAAIWTQRAQRWESIFSDVHQQSGVLNFTGEAGDALITRTYGDKLRAVQAADQLHAAAAIATRAADEASYLQRQALSTVAQARDAGFDVGEDLSLTDTRQSSSPAEQQARTAQAASLAGYLQYQSNALLAADAEAAASLNAITATLALAPLDAPSDLGSLPVNPGDAPKPPVPTTPAPTQPSSLGDLLGGPTPKPTLATVGATGSTPLQPTDLGGLLGAPPTPPSMPTLPTPPGMRAMPPDDLSLPPTPPPTGSPPIMTAMPPDQPFPPSKPQYVDKKPDLPSIASSGIKGCGAGALAAGIAGASAPPVEPIAVAMGCVGGGSIGAVGQTLDPFLQNLEHDIFDSDQP